MLTLTRILRKQRVDSTYPTSGGPFQKGDLIWSSAPSTARALGWVCTSGGSPGTWEAITSVGEAWEDLRISATLGKQPASNYPDWEAYKTNVGAYAFDKTTDQHLYFAVQLPHAYKQGSNIYPHVHWIPKTNGAAGPTRVCWAMDYTWANLGEAFGATTTVYGNIPTTDEVLVADRQYLTKLKTSAGLEYMDGTGKNISSMIICRVYRDADGTAATDNYNDDAYLLELDFHYQRDQDGSATETAK